MNIYTKYFKIAELTIEVNSDILIDENTFHPKFKQFEVDGPGKETIVINHYFRKNNSINVNGDDRIYREPPWAIYKQDENYIYEWIRPDPPYENYHSKAIANKEHTCLDIYNDSEMAETFLKGGVNTLTLFSNDQILLGRLLGYRKGCIVHSLGIIHNGNGYLFVGHSGAGKSTTARMIQNDATILCDDRNIIRKVDDRYMLYGTWNHSDLPDISPQSAPLKGIFFLKQSKTNQLESIKSSKEKFLLFLPFLVKPLTTSDWWENSMDLLQDLLPGIDCWTMKFDKSGEIKDLIFNL